MISANERLQDQAIQHALSVLKLGNGIERDILAILKTVETDVVRQLAGDLAMIEERGIGMSVRARQRLDDMLAELRKALIPVYSDTYDELSSRLTDYASVEAGVQASLIETALAVTTSVKLPSPTLLKAIATERPIQGSLLKAFVKGMEQGAGDRIEQQVRIGMVEGEGAEKIVRRIIGTKAAGYKDGVAEINRRSARAIVRTSINHVSNQAAQETWRANEKLIKGWQFVGTLDSRTTIVCASLDGKVFPIGEGPVPPRHPNCRSVTIAVTKSFREMGLDRDDYTPEQRASMDGQVAATKTSETWLKSQPVERQLEVLGAARQKLFADGKLTLADFIRNNSEVITLDELKRLHPNAFS